MAPPNTHYTKARRVKRGRNGVYVTHAARQLRRQRRARRLVDHSKTVGTEVLWGTMFFIGCWMSITVVVVGGLVLFG